MTSKIRIALIIALCLCPLIAQAEFLGIKKVTEPIIFPVNGPIDTLGRQTLQYATPDHPDSITVFTYLDDGTFIAWDSGGAAYACPGIDTTSRRGETQIWFNRKAHWIDGVPSDSNSYTIAVTVWVWEDGYYRETNATAQIVTDSLNQLYAVRDSINLYDSDTRSWGANALKWNGTTVGTPKNAGYPDVTVKYWGGGAAGDTVASLDSGTYVLPRISMSVPVGTTRDSLYQITHRASDTVTYVALAGGVNSTVSADVMSWIGSTPATLDASGFVKSSVEALLGVTASATNFKEAFDNDNVFATGGFEAVVDSVSSNQMQFLSEMESDSVWLGKLAEYVGNAGSMADTIEYIAGAVDAVRDSMDEATAGGAINLDAATGTLSNAQVDDDVDVNVKTASTGAIEDQDVATLTVDTVGQGTQIWSHGTRTLTSGASFTLSAGAYGSIADSVWAKDTSNALWNGVLSRFGEWNAQAQTVTGSSCGSGSQAVTIYVIDTSGTDELVQAFVTVYNSGVTSIMAFGTAAGGIAGTFGLTASTAYKGLATANGYYFPLYSFTTGSGASHTDTIRGYDIPTSAGSSVPSGQQVQLYDWALSPANDTLYGAKVTITLVGSSNFYTSGNLVPAASVITYAGANDGTANGGKWQETIFGSDSLFAPGGATATYEISIEHPILDLSGSRIAYKALRIPASGSATRLRTIVSGQ